MEEMHPELKDVLEMIHRYHATHKEGCFVFNFIGFKDEEEFCMNCDDCHSQVDETKSMLGAFGDLQNIRFLINDLRDIVEDSVEDGHVNI